MISRFDLILLVAIVGALVITKPSQGEVEAELKSAIIADINSAQIKQKGDFLSNLVTLTCKFDSESCYKLARAAIQVSYKDAVLFSAVKITSGGRRSNCIGAVKNLFCPSFLNR